MGDKKTKVVLDYLNLFFLKMAETDCCFLVF